MSKGLIALILVFASGSAFAIEPATAADLQNEAAARVRASLQQEQERAAAAYNAEVNELSKKYKKQLISARDVLAVTLRKQITQASPAEITLKPIHSSDVPNDLSLLADARVSGSLSIKLEDNTICDLSFSTRIDDRTWYPVQIVCTDKDAKQVRLVFSRTTFDYKEMIRAE